MKARFADGTNAVTDAMTERTAKVENLIVKQSLDSSKTIVGKQNPGVAKPIAFGVQSAHGGAKC